MVRKGIGKDKKTFGEKYIDRVMQDGLERTARQIIESIISYIEDTPNKVSLAYVPQQRKVSHYLRTCKDYELVETNTSTGNVFRWVEEIMWIKCESCDGTGYMIEMPCAICQGLGEIEDELDREIQTSED